MLPRVHINQIQKFIKSNRKATHPLPLSIRIAFSDHESHGCPFPSPIVKISHDLWNESKSGVPRPLTRLAGARREDSSSSSSVSSSSTVSSSAGDDGGADSDAYAAGNGDLWKDVGGSSSRRSPLPSPLPPLPPLLCDKSPAPHHRRDPTAINLDNWINICDICLCIRAGLMVISRHPS